MEPVREGRRLSPIGEMPGTDGEGRLPDRYELLPHADERSPLPYQRPVRLYE
jgi:hypothetical protein